MSIRLKGSITVPQDSSRLSCGSMLTGDLRFSRSAISIRRKGSVMVS